MENMVVKEFRELADKIEAASQEKPKVKIKRVGYLRTDLYSFVDDYYLISSDLPYSKEDIEELIQSVKIKISIEKGAEFEYHPEEGYWCWRYDGLEYGFTREWGMKNLYHVHDEEVKD